MVNRQSAQTKSESMTLPAEVMVRMVLKPKKSRQLNIVLNEYNHNDCNLKINIFLTKYVRKGNSSVKVFKRTALPKIRLVVLFIHLDCFGGRC